MADEKELQDNNNDRENVCYMCHRSESKAGRMLKMPGNMHVCVDCLQRTLDS